MVREKSTWICKFQICPTRGHRLACELSLLNRVRGQREALTFKWQWVSYKLLFLLPGTSPLWEEWEFWPWELWRRLLTGSPSQPLSQNMQTLPNQTLWISHTGMTSLCNWQDQKLWTWFGRTKRHHPAFKTTGKVWDPEAPAFPIFLTWKVYYLRGSAFYTWDVSSQQIETNWKLPKSCNPLLYDGPMLKGKEKPHKP